MLQLLAETPKDQQMIDKLQRALRPSVIVGKVSGGPRTDRGSRAYEVMESIRYTTKLRNKSFIREVP